MTHRLGTLLTAISTAMACSALRAEPHVGKSPGTARLTIQADRPGPRISPTLYGIFFEEINCAGDGGLYAELVRNRSFEDLDPTSCNCWGGFIQGAKPPLSFVMDIDTERQISPKNLHSLKLIGKSLPPGNIGVTNSGWWGIPVVHGAKYDLSLYARAKGWSGELTAALELRDRRRIFAEQKIEGVGGDWKRFCVTLTANGTDPKAQLRISSSHPDGTFWLDMVSLFPRNTWKGRPNGLRPDLAGMLDGLHPSFVRFPGGCWVEGDELKFASRWKRTIGDPADRWTQWNLWQYCSTNGLGFYEYLQMCEDLGAEPLFVINVGMSHRQNVPMGQMGEWVQDALDAIEYANGSTASKWGSLRAKAGHPKPFGLKYMEIGNENGGPAYEERYALFYDAIKAKYPEMRLVADTPTRSRPDDIVDEHYYSNPEFFMRNAHKYDSYDRSGPKIYVGEYAVTERCGQGNLRVRWGKRRS